MLFYIFIIWYIIQGLACLKQSVFHAVSLTRTKPSFYTTILPSSIFNLRCWSINCEAIKKRSTLYYADGMVVVMMVPAGYILISLKLIRTCTSCSIKFISTKRKKSASTTSCKSCRITGKSLTIRSKPSYLSDFSWFSMLIII